MPRVVLTSNAVAYNVVTLARAKRANFPLAPTDLSIQVPDNSVEAANAGATLKVGSPDSLVTPTDVTGGEIALLEGDTKVWPGPNIDAMNKYMKGSVNNQVIYIGAEG